jgi:SAM-dependent methyltransferase
MAAPRQSLYADPAVYDILHAPGTAAEVDALEHVERTLARGPLRPDRLWFEPACGTGRYLRVAAGRGRRVAGCDLSDAMLDYARGRLSSGAILFAADMTSCAAAARRAGLRRGGADFAFNPVNSLRHLPGDAAVLDHLREASLLLKPGALYVVGVSLTDYGWLYPEEDVWTGARGRCRVTQVVNYLPPEPGTARARRETVVSHLTVQRPRGDEHFDDTYDLRTYDRAQWRRLVKRSGLEHAGSFDAWGKPLGDRALPYQLEALRKPGASR